MLGLNQCIGIYRHFSNFNSLVMVVQRLVYLFHKQKVGVHFPVVA